MGPNYDARLESLIAQLDASEVDKVMISAEAVDVPYIKRIENEFVGQCCAKHPDRLIGFGAVHPLEKDAPGRFERDVERHGLKGLKLHPRFQGVSAVDPRILPLAERAAGMGLPIAVDAMLWKPTPLSIQLPINIDLLCKRVPDANIILCHAGGFRFLDALAVVIANDNAYLEISTVLTYFHDTPFEDQFMFILKQAGAKRLIYGSDYPQVPLQSCYEDSRAILAKHGFSEDDLTFIFGGTFASLLPGGE